MRHLATFFLAVLIPVASMAPGFGESKKYQFQRTGTYGLTVVWSGVVVEVEGNEVTPRFTVQNRVFISRWKNFYAYAIQACLTDPDGFTPDPQNCLEAKAKSILIPEGANPNQYVYKFKFRMDGTDMQEEFALTVQTDQEDTEEIKWN